MHQAWQSLQRSTFALVAAGLLIGVMVILAVVFWLVPDQSALETTVSPLDSDNPSTEFITMVIFGVDDLQSNEPALSAVWIGTFEIAHKDGVLLGLPRTFLLHNGQSIEQDFAWTVGSGLDTAFLEAVEETLGLTFNAALVMDEGCFQSSIDILGGIPMDDGQVLDGTAALALHSLSASDPWTALAVQAKILDHARGRLGALREADNLASLLGLTPDQCWLTISDEAAVEMLLRMMPQDEDSIRIETIGSAEY
jgi:hypothetical protein